MIKSIIRDTKFLSKKSIKVTEKDLEIAKDLNDTLNAHKEECEGMAANMIGYNKNMIIISQEMFNIIMINPKIIKKGKPYDAYEACLSLDGVRKTKRFKNITVTYQDTSFESHTKEYTGLTAQIIQHEIDHLNGILI